MALGLLKLMAGLGRAVPRGCRPNPGGTQGPVRITGRELMTAATPRKFRCMQPLEGVGPEGRAVGCRTPGGVNQHAKEVASRVAHATPGLVAQCDPRGGCRGAL